MAHALPEARKDRGMEGMVAKWYATNSGKSHDEFTELARPDRGRASGRQCGAGSRASFVEIANKRAAAAGVSVDFRQGNASHMMERAKAVAGRF
jgi:hypothetical protein